MTRRTAPARLRPGDAGVTLIELAVVLTIVLILAAVAVPATATAIDAGRVRQAATFVTAKFRLSRHQAIFGGRNVGIVFDQVDGEWAFRLCQDGNDNGMRRADIDAGVDACIEGPHRMRDLFPDVSVALDPTIPDPAGATGSDDPVRFGVSDLASFSSNGTCTSGTLYLRSAQGTQYAIRVAGITGRTRLLRFDPASGDWFQW